MADTGRMRLASWKEIATYLRREVRTVIRWEKERGLPVHRVPGGQGGSVFAFADELDQWAAGEQRKEPPPAAPGPAHRRAAPAPARRRRFLLAASMLTIAIVASVAYALGWPRQDLTGIAISESGIEGRDANARTLWSFPLPGRALHLPRRQHQLIDVTGDGRVDALVTVPVQATPDVAQRGVLYALSGSGHLLWERAMDMRLRFGVGEFDAPWQPDDLLAFTNGGEPLVAWAVHHHTWWPSALAVYDGRGARLGTYVQSGWIRLARATADGRHLITGGFSNSRSGAAFAVLDARRPDGASPEDPGSPYECLTCPPGRPLRYLVIDWSDVATGLPPDERDVAVANMGASVGIELRAVQRRGVELIVELSPTFDVVRRAVSDTFWEWHRRLEQAGSLDHSREACPYRDGPIVREWTPAVGWRTIGAADHD